VRDSLSDPAKPATKASSADWRERLREGLEMAPIELVAILAQTRMSLKRVSLLKVGDVIDIPSAEDVVLMIDDTPFMYGRFGSNDEKLAVRLTGRSETNRHQH
jgi:flagellar motor switch protein FliM